MHLIQVDKIYKRNLFENRESDYNDYDSFFQDIVTSSSLDELLYEPNDRNDNF
ncbi:hypothetical protein SAMN05421578_13313 [Paenibacillus macquariensis]|uniref:Uncharacterized protein n=1 Tax=Paenibacillus macquariensis TaxID=948756 RepID=A0ABY1KDZ1_9BACL|nr:hypothetical protein SAMN05421578_13313 [Paenibacillus macquariensis]